MRITVHACIALGVAAAASLQLIMKGSGDSLPDDPHVPKRRSKGEKARNRKYRGGRP